MRRKILAAGMFGCFALMSGVGGTVFWFVKQNASVSAALIEEEPIRLEMCFWHSGEHFTEDPVTGLLPGETVGRDPAVILDGTSPEAYIRVRISFGGILEGAPSESQEERRERLERIRDLWGQIHFCEGWLEGEDGCVYYQEKVPPGSIIPVYEQVGIPENWDNEIAEQTFTIELSAEAVRSDHLDPWLPEGQAIRSW